MNQIKILNKLLKENSEKRTIFQMLEDLTDEQQRLVRGGYIKGWNDNETAHKKAEEDMLPVPDTDEDIERPKDEAERMKIEAEYEEGEANDLRIDQWKEKRAFNK